MSDNTSAEKFTYQVLARKYRPATFSDLVGQDVMVKILKNSFLSERIAHAFMLTGVRGVGKTTTARIIAKGLNCVGLDGLGTSTILPCGKCDNCASITKGSHVDVMEFDAASRTGVSDIREIIDSVYYRAASARYKIYVIDEVHMLSNSAFNALLKTLEEPPKHVKFIFATTEINKGPTTVLSRCQRFDLRRIESKAMVEYLKGVSKQEGFSINEECLGQIVRASEGSMRDALSLLEQIFVDTNGQISIESVRLTLGLADRGQIFDLFELLMRGELEDTLRVYNKLYSAGADPIGVLKELCEITHLVTLFKLSPTAINDVGVSPDERLRSKTLSDQISVRELSRTWQLLVKVLDESSEAINSKMSVEMGLIRVAYSANLPTPDELIRKISSNKNIKINSNQNQVSSAKDNSSQLEVQNLSTQLITQKEVDEKTNLQANVAQEPQPENKKLDVLSHFKEVIELIKTQRDMELLIEVENNLRLVNYQIGRIEFQPTDAAAANLASRLTTFLKAQTGSRWVVSVVSSGGRKTIREERLEKNLVFENESMANPIVLAIFEKFPDSKIEKIHEAKKNRESILSKQFGINAKDQEWDPVEEE